MTRRFLDRNPRWPALACAFALFTMTAACTPAARASTTRGHGAAPYPAAHPVDAPAVPPHAYLSRLELEVLAELNRARTDPVGYARHLEAMLGWFQGRNM